MLAILDWKIKKNNPTEWIIFLAYYISGENLKKRQNEKDVKEQKIKNNQINHRNKMRNKK